MAKGNKYYVVWVGNKPGIYDSWQECQVQIKGFPQARYKAFKTREEAQSALESGSSYSTRKKALAAPANTRDIVWESISVDAACSGNPGIMEYRGVETKSKKEIFRQGPFEDGTNNIGEFLALVHALALLKKKGLNSYPIYTDSRTALSWVKNKKVKTTLAQNRKNAQLFDMINRAIEWLKANSFKNPIIKWQTENWGEIPADFGRK